MSTDIERLIAQLEVRQNRFERDMRRAQETTRRRTRQMERDFTSVNRVGGAQLAALGRQLAAFGAGFFGAFTLDRFVRGVRQAIGDLSNIGKAARDAGIDVEDLQGLMRGFARGTRISESDLVSALERFNRRVGEAVNGMGPLNATLERYGINVRDANGRVRTQTEMLREVARAIQGVRNEQERLSIAQAAFGDVGRRMAQALSAGPEALDAMITEARAAGDIIDRNLIHRAELLDDRFDELTRTVRTFFQTLAVGMTGGMTETPQEVIERLFGSLDRAREALGSDLLNALTAELGVIDQHAPAVEAVAETYRDWADSLHEVIRGLDETAQEFDDLGAADLAQQMREVADNINDAGISLRDGQIEATEFRAELHGAHAAALDLVGQVQALDGASLAAILSRFDALFARIVAAAGAVRDLQSELGAAPASPFSGALPRIRGRAEAVRDFLTEEQRLAARTREQIDLEREVGRVRARALDQGITLTDALAESQARANIAAREALNAPSGGRGGGGGGGAAQDSDFARAVESIRDRTTAMESEAAALVAAAASGREYGQAIQYAYQRARLLHAAQRDGLQVTPELEAEIDRLADAYARAGESAREAADNMRQVQDDARAGAHALTDIFGAMLRGGDAARQSLARLLAQVAQVQMMRGITALSDAGVGGSLVRVLGGLLRPFDTGGYTGDGGRTEPKGVVHGGEYVFSKAATSRIGKDNLEALHRRAQGYARGGFVGGAAALPVSRTAPDRTVLAVELRSDMLDAKISEGAARVVVRRTPEIVDRSVMATHKSFEEFKPG